VYGTITDLNKDVLTALKARKKIEERKVLKLHKKYKEIKEE